MQTGVSIVAAVNKSQPSQLMDSDARYHPSDPSNLEAFFQSILPINFSNFLCQKCMFAQVCGEQQEDESLARPFTKAQYFHPQRVVRIEVSISHCANMTSILATTATLPHTVFLIINAYEARSSPEEQGSLRASFLFSR